MAYASLFGAAFAALAAFGVLAAAWRGRGKYVRGRSALLAVGIFLVAGALGGFLLHDPVSAFFDRSQMFRARTRTEEIFRTDGLLRALNEVDPERAAVLRTRFVGALAAAKRDEVPQVEFRLRCAALRVGLGSALGRLPNASDEAAARLADALLAALEALPDADAPLCVGLAHPQSAEGAALADDAISRLPDSTRKDLASAVALTLVSSVVRPQAAPWPKTADAALANMFAEVQPEFRSKYGDPEKVRALLTALADPRAARKTNPRTLCAFARDLLRALLRMPPEVRGPGLRRLLGGPPSGVDKRGNNG